MKKLFISQPMRGRSDLGILAERDELTKLAKDILKEDVELIDSYVHDTASNSNITSLWLLSKAIELLSTADVIIFAPGWENARGCKIEHECAVQYGYDRIEFNTFSDYEYLSMHCNGD